MLVVQSPTSLRLMTLDRRDELTDLLGELSDLARNAPARLSQRVASLSIRDQAELARVRFYLNYGRKWPEGAPEREKALEKALELADAFVDRGVDFFIMEYDGQLNRGIIALELGRYLLASDHLSVLYDIDPQSPKPWSPTLTTAIKDVRLQSVLYGTRALSAAGRYRDALDVIKTYVLTPRKGIRSSCPGPKKRTSSASTPF